MNRHTVSSPKVPRSARRNTLNLELLYSIQMPLVLLLLVTGMSRSTCAATKPNVILVMTDDNDQLSWAIGGNFCDLLVFLGNFKPQLSQANSREIGDISYTLLHRVRVWPL
jgi:hypothetical protein